MHFHSVKTTIRLPVAEECCFLSSTQPIWLLASCALERISAQIHAPVVYRPYDHSAASHQAACAHAAARGHRAKVAHPVPAGCTQRTHWPAARAPKRLPVATTVQARRERRIGVYRRDAADARSRTATFGRAQRRHRDYVCIAAIPRPGVAGDCAADGELPSVRSLSETLINSTQSALLPGAW